MSTLKFKAAHKPFICLGGTLLKGYNVGQDANNHLFPIAYAIVHMKIRDNCKWFLERLHKDLGDYKFHGWNSMFNQHKVKKCTLRFYNFTIYY